MNPRAKTATIGDRSYSADVDHRAADHRAEHGADRRADHVADRRRRQVDRRVDRRLDAEALARELGGKRSGRQWLCKCPAHEDKRPSLLVFDGHTSVQVRCQAGCAPIDVIAMLRARGLWSGVAAAGDVHATKRQRIEDNREAEVHAAQALRIWREAIDPRDTLGEAYLKKRRLKLPPEPMHVLRFHPACPRGFDKQPALIALMRDVRSNQPRAIQRIFLTPQVTDDGAMMLGPAGGAAMKITDHSHTFWDHISYCPCLHVCEGLETGLALLHRYKRAPIWALGSAGAIERFPVLFGVGSLMICADHDKVDRNGRRPGPDAGRICKQRWGDAGRPVEMIMPAEEGKDFADELPGGGDG